MNNYITFTCDSNYFPYSIILIESILKNSPKTKIIGRFVNCTLEQHKQLTKYKRLYKIFDNKKLSTIRNLKTKDGNFAVDDFIGNNKTKIKPIRLFYSEQIAYCSNIKFNTLYDWMKNYNGDNIIYLDVDSIVRGPLDDLFESINNNDFAFFKDIPYTEQFENSNRLEESDFLYHGGFIGIHNNKKNELILERYRDQVSKNIFDWDIDEYILPKLINENIDILEIDKSYKDEDLSDKSIIWSGSGRTKFDNHRYIVEAKKYNIDL